MTLNKDTTGKYKALMLSKVGYNWNILFISFPGKASFSLPKKLMLTSEDLNMCLGVVQRCAAAIGKQIVKYSPHQVLI